MSKRRFAFKNREGIVKADDFFEKFAGESLTYDDLIFLPQFVGFGLDAVSLKSSLSDSLSLNIPILSSPMDTVTEAEMAVAVALQGGLGVIHYNMPPEKQREQIEQVKRFQNGFVIDPIALPPAATIRDVVRIRREQGYSTIPITADGTPHGKLLGMITKYDYSTLSEEYLSRSVAERMMSVEELVVATFEELCCGASFDLKKANELLLDSHSAALPIVDREGNMRYLITRSDLDKHQNYPNAAQDGNSCLLVGAAVETWEQKARPRIEAIEESVDVVVFDTSQGYTQYEIDLIRWTKERFPHLTVVGGNVVTKEACEALIDAGADAVRIGMGSGSICTTQEVGGIGRGQATALFECAGACHAKGRRCIADGGLKTSADIAKAYALGADAVMLGSLLACTSEAPGKTHIKDGVRLKEYRGMGSLQAMEQGSAVRYGTEKSAIRIPEGVSGMVPSRGSVSEWVPCLLQGVRQGLHKLGFSSLEKIREALSENRMELERRSVGAHREGGVHSLYEIAAEGITAERTPRNPKEFFVNRQRREQRVGKL